MKVPMPKGQEDCKRCGMMLHSNVAQWHKCRGSDMGRRPANISIDDWMGRPFELFEKVEVPDPPKVPKAPTPATPRAKQRHNPTVQQWAFLLVFVVCICSLVGSVVYQISQENHEQRQD